MDIEVRESTNKQTRNIRVIVPLDNGKIYKFKSPRVLEIIQRLAMKVIFLEDENERLLSIVLGLMKDEMPEGDAKEKEIESESE